MEVTVEEARLADPLQAKALVEIIDAYAREAGGQAAPLTETARSALIPGLMSHPNALVLLAFVSGDPVGTAVCIWGFSTFAGKRLINIHDLAVLPDFRGRGVGRALLAEVERRARERDCCRITLEVNDANDGAKRLYEATGFGPWDRPTWFVTKPL